MPSDELRKEARNIYVGHFLCGDGPASLHLPNIGQVGRSFLAETAVNLRYSGSAVNRKEQRRLFFCCGVSDFTDIRGIPPNI